MTQDLFGDQLDTPVDDVNKDYLSELVGEGRKYKTPNDLAKAYSHADRALVISNRTKDQLRDDYLALKTEFETSKRFEQLVDQLDKRSQLPPVISETPPAKDREQPSFDPAVIDARVSETVQRLKQQEKESQNFNTVMSRLNERFGSNYQNILKEQTQALGLTADDVNSLAKKSPTAFFKTMGLEQMPTQPFDAPPRSQTTGFRPQGEKKRDWTYYQDIKKNNPQEYKSSRIQNQMLKDYEELGKDFETGDFRRYGDGI